MFNKKKSVFFTLTAIVLTLVIILSFNVYSKYNLNEKMNVVEVRITTMNNFIKDVSQDLEKGVYITSFRSLLSMIQHITDNGTFIDNVDYTFSELFINGSIDDNVINLMTNSTFPDWVNKIQIEAEKIDINANFTVNNVSITQEDPWKIKIAANINMNVQDKKQTSSWSINKNIITDITIESFEDPLYIVNSQGKLTNTIRVSPYTVFVQGSNADNLVSQINESYYINTTTAPSFLMRLEGNLSSSSYGIESLVNVEEFSDQGISVKSRSAVDYIYFGNQTATSCVVNETFEEGTFTDFRLDNDAEPYNHLDNYQAKCR